MQQILLFSFTAMANPTLLAATTVMLLLPSPKALMAGYLLGAMITGISIGLLIVFELQDRAIVGTTKHTLSPAADLVIGGLLLLIALVLGSGRPRRSAPEEDKEPPRWQRALSKGSPRTTFVVGVCLTLPGASYLAALTGIVKLDPGTAQSVLLVLMVNMIMLALLEIPLLGYVLAPDRTTVTVARVKGWFARNGRRALVLGAALIGSLLIARGVITLVS